MIIRRGDPLNELQKLFQETGAVRIFAEEDFTPFARQRDDRVSQALPLTLVNGLTVYHPNAVLKPDGTPYTVFTPFSKKWKSLPGLFLNQKSDGGFARLSEFPVSVPLPQMVPVEGFPASEAEAEKRVSNFLNLPVETYDDHRNRMDLDGTSMLSPYLRFGMISAGRMVAQVKKIIEENPSNQGSITWLNELIWREFYQSILYHYPNVRKEAFNPQFADDAEFTEGFTL